MNASFIGTKLLATGQSIPFTGQWVNIAEARNALFVVYGSGIVGNTSATLQTKTPFVGSPLFSNTGAQVGVPFYTFNPLTNGYSAPALLDSPISQVRLVVASGSGSVWSYASIQN